MKQILSFRWALALALVGSSVEAQRTVFNVTSSISISAPVDFVVAARTLALGAVATNARGAVLHGRNIAWKVGDATKASIDANGVLHGISPGLETVTATDTDAGVSGTMSVYIYPGSVSVATSASSLQVGDTITVTAQALDADGKGIAGVPFQYFTDVSGVATISSVGALTGVAEGRVTVTAAIDMGPAFARFTNFSTVEVIRRAAFQLTTLITSDVSSSATTTLVPTRMSASGSYVAGVTSLSNGGQALVLWKNGIQTIATTGSLLNGRVVTRFESVSVNSQGDIAAIADTQAEWCEQILVLFQAASKWAPTIIDDNKNCSYSLQPGSLDSKLGLVYRFSNNLYYRGPDGTVQTLLMGGSHPTGIDVVNYISNWTTTAFGDVLIEAQNGIGLPVYFSWNGTQLKKLFAAGDAVGIYSSTWANLPAEINAGEYITRIGGYNWSSISRLKNGVWTTVAMNGQNGLGWVQNGFDGAGTTIFFFADSPNGTSTSLMRFDGTSTTVLGTYPNWREISQVNAVGGDAAVVFGTMGASVSQVIRFSGTTGTPILHSGVAITATASPALAQASIPKGINPSGTILRTYGDALIRATATGFTPVLLPGDALPVGNLSNIGAVAGNRLGDVAIIAQHGPKYGLFIYRNGKFQILADTDDPIPGGATLGGFATYSDTQMAMNNLGHVAASTYAPAGNTIFLYSTNAVTAKTVMRVSGLTPSGTATYTGINGVAIDDTDRVAFLANLSNGHTGLFLWSQGAVTELAETGQKDPAGRTYQGLYNVQAGGTSFVMRAYSTVNEVLSTDGSTMKVLAYDGYTASFGTTMNYLIGMEVTTNSRGDVAFPVSTPSGAALFVKHADGTDSLVAIGGQRGPDNDWLLDIYGSGIGEQGDIVFSALSWMNGHQRIAIYRATPSGN